MKGGGAICPPQRCFKTFTRPERNCDICPPPRCVRLLFSEHRRSFCTGSDRVTTTRFLLETNLQPLVSKVPLPHSLPEGCRAHPLLDMDMDYGYGYGYATSYGIISPHTRVDPDGHTASRCATEKRIPQLPHSLS